MSCRLWPRVTGKEFLMRTMWDVEYNMEELLEMITTARVLFSGENALVEVGIPLVIVGDIHGQVILEFVISSS
uniref:Uncharacterized protein n=1 Tax=Parascaris equorum TaxID=6256 RepID=A0A914RBB6_PAREQ